MSNDEKMDLILQHIDNIAIDRDFNSEDHSNKAKAIHKRVTQLFSVSDEPTLDERTKDALGDKDEV